MLSLHPVMLFFIHNRCYRPRQNNEYPPFSELAPLHRDKFVCSLIHLSRHVPYLHHATCTSVLLARSVDERFTIQDFSRTDISGFAHSQVW
ncbi:hypothetical protein V6N13_139420 [Hibiscus sabdariffa]|uniref:Uncharacterized protein n=1 Tax=Hibiscus sabdariffa TaxID=183260 RepID=A0ABR2C879_9ROSI